MAVKNMPTYNKSAMHRPAYRWPYWLALIAMLWTSLSPALARVWVDERVERIEICTSTGVVWVSAGAPTDGAADVGNTPTAPAMAALACDWCLLHAGAWNVPPGEHVAPVAFAVAITLADAPIASAFDEDHWWRPQPHAPPLLSPSLR